MKENWGKTKGGKNTSKKFSKAEINERMRVLRNKRINKDKFKTVEITSSFLEFYGALMGDGCLSLEKEKTDIKIIKLSLQDIASWIANTMSVI